jgi:hypothetical protein
MFNKKLTIECKILQPELLRPKDVLVFTSKTERDLTVPELLALRQQVEEFLSGIGIENKVVYLNNADLRIVSSMIQ